MKSVIFTFDLFLLKTQLFSFSNTCYVVTFFIYFYIFTNNPLEITRKLKFDSIRFDENNSID